MTKLVVLYDACVLYPAPLRDLLMHLALTNIYQAKWTANIHEEWIRNVLLKRPDLKPAQLQRTRNLMDTSVRDVLVEQYEHLIPALNLPDVNDRHVLAAAIKSAAAIILTFNLKDFPHQVLKKYHIKAVHPDQFLSQLLTIEPVLVCAAISRLRAALKNPPISVSSYLSILEQQNLPQTVADLRHLVDYL
ncbi:MAG TPA: PIN domain-containing protein [Candidatus Babeliales bacterium]|nr:PIN domain-containing protein [Candidatus Babeliales bacterium]